MAKKFGKFLLFTAAAAAAGAGVYYYLQKKNELAALDEFDDAMWLGLVDFVTVQNKEDILVTFKGGMEIAV